MFVKRRVAATIVRLLNFFYMKAYLEKCETEWFDDFVYTARQPIEDRGIKIVPFNGTYLDEFIEKTVFDENDIIVGSVEATKAFWQKVGITIPKYIGYPESLNSFYKRTIKRTRFGKITIADLPIFIKPAYDVKLFTGFILDKTTTLSSISMFYDVNNNTAIYTSDVLNIKSEYRCFVHKGKLVGVKHYDGDFLLFPDMSIVQNIIDLYKDQPVSYTLDIGVFKVDHNLYDTCLIEINDFWAIGGYGLDGKTYARMLIDRFQEIKK